MHNIQRQTTNKQFLRSIVESNYDIPEHIDSFVFAKALLSNLASPDGELRDELSSMILTSGIIAEQKLTPQQLKELLFILLDKDHLFYRIGEVGTDSVFMRSFSNLVIAAILYIDTLTTNFSPSVIQQTKTALLRYAREEKDWRGYVEGKGWANAMAHLADALDECAQNPCITSEERKELLVVVRELAKLGEPLYNEEDVRLAEIPFHIILGKQVDDEFLSSWIESCYIPREPDIATWTQVTNMKNFLRSLYFLLLWDKIAPSHLEQIMHVLKRQDEMYVEAKEGR